MADYNCEYCKNENPDTCTFNKIKVNGKWYNRKIISYGGETLGSRCRECGILLSPKHYHHFGCSGEECPHCWRSSMKCDCKKEALKKGDLEIPIN